MKGDPALLSLNAHARLLWPDAVRTLRPVFEHMREHGAEVAVETNRATLRMGARSADFRQEGEFLEIGLRAPDIPALHMIKVAVASHILELGGRPDIDLVWSGDGSDLRVPPNFRILRVTTTEALGPHLRRIRFAGEDLARFASDENLHCKLLFPQPGIGNPEWPTIGRDGLPIFPRGEKRLDIRTYTIRRIDAARGIVEIDFVLHEDAGPGAAWAARAGIGEVIGMSGPGGHGAAKASWYLLAGDETALPAIARILESLPATAGGMAFIEVDGSADELPLSSAADVPVRWLHRNGAPPGSTTLLQDAVRETVFPDEASVFVWVGAEFEAFKAIRGHLRRERGLPRERHLVVSYWRRGRAEGESLGGGD